MTDERIEGPRLPLRYAPDHALVPLPGDRWQIVPATYAEGYQAGLNAAAESYRPLLEAARAFLARIEEESHSEKTDFVGEEGRALERALGPFPVQDEGTRG